MRVMVSSSGQWSSLCGRGKGSGAVKIGSEIMASNHPRSGDLFISRLKLAGTRNPFCEFSRLAAAADTPAQPLQRRAGDYSVAMACAFTTVPGYLPFPVFLAGALATLRAAALVFFTAFIVHTSFP